MQFPSHLREKKFKNIFIVAVVQEKKKGSFVTVKKEHISHF